MGNETAQNPPSTGQTLSSDAALVGANIPVVGGLVSSFFKMSSKGRRVILLILILLIIYPLISLAMALLIISKSPASVKKSARGFVLSSIGVDDETMDRVNASNLVIDASIPKQFILGANDDAVQRVAAGQRITFEGFLRKTHIDGGPECAVEQSVPDEPIGRLTVRSLASNADPYGQDIDPTFGELFTIGTLGDGQWKKFQEASKSGQPEAQHPLKIKLTENPTLAGSGFLKCNKVSLDLYMNIFKPPLVRGS